MKPGEKVALYIGVLLIMFAFLAVFRQEIIEADVALFGVINGFHFPALDYVLIPITYYGSVFFWIFLIFLTWIRKKRRLSMVLILAFAIDSFLSLTLKWLFNRARPDGIHRYFFFSDIDSGKSFPSGHSEEAFSGSVILSAFCKNNVAFYALAVLTALSRIYIGVHYPIDTIFGSVIGLIVGNIALGIPTRQIEIRIKKFLRRLGFED
jgi:undecaprenyl-diphosphatase